MVPSERRTTNIRRRSGAIGQICLLRTLPDLGRTRFHHLVEQALVVTSSITVHPIGPTPPDRNANG